MKRCYSILTSLQSSVAIKRFAAGKQLWLRASLWAANQWHAALISMTLYHVGNVWDWFMRLMKRPGSPWFMRLMKRPGSPRTYSKLQWEDMIFKSYGLQCVQWISLPSNRCPSWFWFLGSSSLKPSLVSTMSENSDYVCILLIPWLQTWWNGSTLIGHWVTPNRLT